MQGVGRQYTAQDVVYRSNDTFAELQMDIASAYPKAAGLTSWIRTVRLDRARSLTISDTFKLREESDAVVQSLMTPCAVSEIAPGQLRLTASDRDVVVLLRYEPVTLAADIETIELQDDKLKEVWGKRLQRVLLKATEATCQETWKVQISKFTQW
jgi:hypothetical protein